MERVCSTCLCTDRVLNQFNNLQWFHIKSTLWEWFDPEGSGNYNVNLDTFKLCWECTAVLVRVHQLKNRVFRAQRMMLENAREQSQNLAKLSSLGFRTKNTYDNIYVHNEDPNDLPTDLFDINKTSKLGPDEDDIPIVSSTIPEPQNGSHKITPPSLPQGVENNNNTCKSTGSMETKETNNSETAGDEGLENKETEEEPINDNTANVTDVAQKNNTRNGKHLLNAADKEKQKNENTNSQDSKNKHRKNKIQEEPFDKVESLTKAANTAPLPKVVQLEKQLLNHNKEKQSTSQHLTKLSLLGFRTKNTYDSTYVHNEDPSDLATHLYETKETPEMDTDEDENDVIFVSVTIPEPENDKHNITPPSLLQGVENNKIKCEPTGSIETKETNNSDTAGDEGLQNNVTEDESINDNTANITDVAQKNNSRNGKHLLNGADKEKQKNENKNSQDSKNKHRKRKIEEELLHEDESLMKIAKPDKERAANKAPSPKEVQLSRPGVKLTIVHLNEKLMLKPRETGKKAESYQKRDFKCCHCNIGFDGEKQLFNHNKEMHSISVPSGNGSHKVTPPSLPQEVKNKNSKCKSIGPIETKETKNSGTAGGGSLQNNATEEEPINDNTAIGSNDNRNKNNSDTTSDEDSENELTEDESINESMANVTDVTQKNNTKNMKRLLNMADKDKQRNKNKNSQDTKNKHTKRKIEEEPFDKVKSVMKIAKPEKQRAAYKSLMPKKVQLAQPEVKFTIVDMNEKQMLKSRELDKEAEGYKKRDFKCFDCIIGFDDKKQLLSHRKEKHSTQAGSQRCPVCKVRFNDIGLFKLHVDNHYRSYKCAQCSFQDHRKFKIDAHIVKKHDLKPSPVCPDCDVEFENLYETVQMEDTPGTHVGNDNTDTGVTEHKERYACSKCSKKFKSKNNLKLHNDFYHLRKSKYRCEICNKIFISNTRLHDHIQQCHVLMRPKNHICNVCGKKFFTATMLQSHQYTHFEQRTIICEDCGDTFKQRAALNTHTLLHRDKSGQQREKRDC